MIIVIAEDTAYVVDNLVPGDGEVFTDENGLLDLSAYQTEDFHDGVVLWGAHNPE